MAARAGGAPDPDAADVLSRFEKSRQNEFAEIVERHAVAKEEGFVGRHRIDDFAGEFGMLARGDAHDERVEIDKAEAMHDRLKPALGEIGLVRRRAKARWRD